MKLGFINGLRGLAILGVVFHHLAFPSFSYGGSGEMSIVDLIASSGWLGVNLFFFLSGFVLFLPYVRGQRTLQETRDFLNFYDRRFRRLYPLYVLVAFVSLLFVYKGDSGHRWALDFLFVTFPFRESTFMPGPNWVLWSIGVEIWFSLLFPFAALAVKRYGFGRAFLIGIPISLVVRLVGQRYFGTRETGDILNFVSDSVFGRFDDFLFGMYAAHGFFFKPANESHRRYLYLAASLGCIAVTVVLWALWWRQELPEWSAAFYSLFLNVGLLLFTTRVADELVGIRRFLEIQALQMLGLMCYSLYVWHGIIAAKLAPHSTVLSYGSYVIILLFMSLLTYRFVEFGHEVKWRKLLPSGG
jgi:peptidoglycan/LPS O-acetylase OafA/YrhL